MRIAQITDIHWRKHIAGTSDQPERACRLMPDILADTLTFLRSQDIDLIAVTGDLIEAPVRPDPAARLEYEDIRRLLDDSGIPYVVAQGNHDDLDALWSVFDPPPEPLHIKGCEVHVFQDASGRNGPAVRVGAELERFERAVSEHGPRNQIHIQHYLLAPETFRGDKTACVNQGELLQPLVNSRRVLLSISGHKHRIIPLMRLEGTAVAAVQGFFSYPYVFAIYTIDEKGGVEQQMIAAADVIADNVLANPYKGRLGVWLKGNLHFHCAEASRCSSVPLAEGIDRYEKHGYDFLGVTDHNRVTPLDILRKTHPGMVLLEGCEHAGPGEVVVVGERVPAPKSGAKTREYLETIGNAVAFLSHPEGPSKGYWTADAAAVLPNLTGLEIFNGHYGATGWRQRGAGWEYTALWDELLSRGVRLLGFADDDFHDPQDTALSANCVLSSSKTPEAIVAALKAGAFYASSGLRLKSVHEYKGHVVVMPDMECRGRFIGPGGRLLKESIGLVHEYTVSDEAYVRFEAEHNGRKLWLQPLFRI